MTSRSKLALALVKRVASTDIGRTGDDRERYLRWRAAAQKSVEEELADTPIFVVVGGGGRAGVFLNESDAREMADSLGVEVQRRGLL